MTTLRDSSDDFFCPADCKTDRGSQIYTIFKHKSAQQVAKNCKLQSPEICTWRTKKKLENCSTLWEWEREIQAQWFRTTVEKKKAMTNPLQFFWRLLCPADCKTDPQLEDDETSCKMNCEKQIGETIARVLTDSLISQSSNLHNSSPHKNLLFLFFCFRIPRWRRCNGESRSLWHGHCSELLKELGSLCAPAGMTNTQKRQP